MFLSSVRKVSHGGARQFMSTQDGALTFLPDRGVGFVVADIAIFVNLVNMKKTLFKALARLNKVLLPRYSQRDISRLSKFDKALVAYRYWVTLQALD